MLAAAGVVIVLVIGALFACVDHLANLVRLGETVAKIERRAEQVMRERAAAPWLGGVPPTTDAPPMNWVVVPEDTGYGQHLDTGALQKVAAEAGGLIAVERLPGSLADPLHPIARPSWDPDAAAVAAIRKAFAVGPERSFAGDPRYCLVVLSEIGSRALSPGVNDPGTAIGVIATLQRLLTLWARDMAPSEDPTPRDRVLVPGLETGDLFDDAFGPLIRDAAGMVEVGVRLQKTFAVLAAAGPADFAAEARALSQKAVRHARAALDLEEDADRLAALAADVGAASGKA
jgi:uncharacterized membrane protein